MLSQEGCVRCGGDLEPIADRQDLLELHQRERRFVPSASPGEPSPSEAQQPAS
jgi:hypothetical protein